MTTRTQALFAAGLGLIASLTTGCHASRDAYTYESRTLMPMTVTIVDVATDESIWSMDIPVNKNLRLRFYDDRDPSGATPSRPAMMRWEVDDPKESSGALENEIAVPLAGARRIDVTLRDTPEFAGNSYSPPQPVTQSAPPSDSDMLPSEMKPAKSDSSEPPSLDPVVIPEGNGG